MKPATRAAELPVHGMLRRCLEAIAAAGLPVPDLARIPADDAATAGLIARGDLDGIFNCATPRARDWLPRAGVRCAADVAAVRALECDGDGARFALFAARRDCAADGFPAVLASTRGLLLWQEQVLDLAQECAGYGWLEARELAAALRGDADASEPLFARFRARASSHFAGIFMDEALVLLQQREVVRCAQPRQPFLDAAALTWRTAYLKAHFPKQFMQ